jgi:microcin C transport system substrate-binding protein
MEEIAHGRGVWLRAMVFNTRKPAFADIRTRQAISLMFDDAWMNRNFFFGSLKRIDSAFPNSELAARGAPSGMELDILKENAKDLPPSVFDTIAEPKAENMRDRQRRAMALLKEAGWTYHNQKLTDASGAALQFEILLDNANDEKMALAFIRALTRLGIQARVRTVDTAQFTGRLDGFDYDMVFFRWINSLSPGNEQVNYWSSDAAAMNGSRNYAGVKNPAIDRLASGIARTTDRDGLVAYCRALDRALMAGHYMVPLFYMGRDLVSHDTRLKRPAETPVYGIVLESWWRED